MEEKAYKDECRVTLLGFILITFLTHLFPVYFLFPELTQMTVLGFPAHYLMTLVGGWLVLIPVYYIYIQVTDRIEAEIEESSSRAAELGGASVYAAQAKGGAE